MLNLDRWTEVFNFAGDYTAGLDTVNLVDFQMALPIGPTTYDLPRIILRSDVDEVFDFVMGPVWEIAFKTYDGFFGYIRAAFDMSEGYAYFSRSARDLALLAIPPESHMTLTGLRNYFDEWTVVPEQRYVNI